MKDHVFIGVIKKGIIMKKNSCSRIQRFQECLSSLGKIRCRPLFGGYSLAIEGTVFAMVSGEEIYLRLSEQSAAYRVANKTPLLTMCKHGRLVALKYYLIDETLWRDNNMLFSLSKFSLQTARYEKHRQCYSRRLKDLPNISFHMELMLINVGVMDACMLRELGAKQAWLRLLEINKALTLNVLYLLEGAIIGVHAAALPAQLRQELWVWANTREQ